MANETKQFDFPLNGRLITKLDPALLPEGHFQSLQNLRYNDGGIEPISGMTKINAAAFNYTKVKTGFQFKKSVPNVESHVFAQTNSATTGARIVKSDNAAAVPLQDTFTSFITLPTNNYVNFSEAPDQSMVACDGYTNYVYSGNEYRVAKFINFDPAGTFSYDYTNIANNNLTDTNNVFSLAGVAGVYSCYVGSTRPISGIKFYIKTANATAATAAVTYWNGTTFAAVSNLVDNTTTAGKTLSKTGTIVFDSTVSSAKVKAINENVAYYYLVAFTGIDAGTEISQLSLIAPVQGLTDIWDGTPRQIYSFITNSISRVSGWHVYGDYTSNVYSLDYYAGNTSTYVNIGTQDNDEYFYIGFQERLLGIKIYLGGTNGNTVTCTMTIDYWNGSDWASVGTLDDGVSISGVAFAHNGTVTWTPPSEKSEYVTSVGNSAQWYFYRIHFSTTLSSEVYIDNITGIPAQVTIHPYRFPVLWQNRIWLLNDQAKDKNAAISSSYGTVCVFNGTDSARLTFGGTQEVVAAAPLFTRYGGSIYENLVVCKRNQTFLVDGTTPSTYIVYEIAKTVGCIASQTLIACDTGYEVTQGLTKHVIVWLSASGIVMFDSNSIINISNDIADRFDPQSSNYINTAISENFTAFYDAKRFTYHIQIATGASTTLNEEWAYDLQRRKWYQVNRGAKYLACGLEVEDTIGNKYTYGGTDDGYLERLEYGNTFDGVAIDYKFRLPDGLLARSLMYETEIRRIKLTGKANTTASKVTCRHYADGSTTATTVYTIDQNVTGKRIFQLGESVSFKAIFHSFEFEISTSDVAGGFYPLYVSGLYKVIREDLVN